MLCCQFKLLIIIIKSYSFIILTSFYWLLGGIIIHLWHAFIKIWNLFIFFSLATFFTSSFLATWFFNSISFNFSASSYYILRIASISASAYNIYCLKKSLITGCFVISSYNGIWRSVGEISFDERWLDICFEDFSVC